MRTLSEQEITVLEENGCWAESWTGIMVADDFVASRLHSVRFYGEVTLGMFDGSVELSAGYFRQTGIYNATLRNVSIGDNCLIENVRGCINEYDIGDGCIIIDVSRIETTEGATFGQMAVVPVLNEACDGNVMLYGGLTSQTADLQLSHASDADFTARFRSLVRQQVESALPERGRIGQGVKVTQTMEIVNTVVGDGSEVHGATRLSDCTLHGSSEANIFIGAGVIIDNCIVSGGSSVTDGTRLTGCYVGEACQMASGFTAENSLFFANTCMANGEACSAFCGPFSVSHHKSTLLIGGRFSLYNAGSATNFSNHAYKMGPVHHGTFERGSKTASGTHVMLPARVGAFSVCMGKLMCHPDTSDMPFSYLIGESPHDVLVPGRNLVSVGLYRDVRKWARRDMRPRSCRQSNINFSWLSPYTVEKILRAKRSLETLRDTSGSDASAYSYHGFTIKASSLHKGIRYYDMALRMYLGEMMEQHKQTARPQTSAGLGEWRDLGGMLLPNDELERLVDDVKNGAVASLVDIAGRLDSLHAQYDAMAWSWTRRMVCDMLEQQDISAADADSIIEDGKAARREWIDEIRRDAEREYALGDIDKGAFDEFMRTIN